MCLARSTSLLSISELQFHLLSYGLWHLGTLDREFGAYLGGKHNDELKFDPVKKFASS